MDIGRIMAISFLVGGAAMGAGGIAIFNHMRTFAATATTCIGKLVAYESLKSDTSDLTDRRTTNHYPVVEFSDSNGTKRRFTASTGSNQKPYKLGAEVTVVYDPKDPDSADIESKLYQWMIPALVSGLGAASLTIGIAIW
jgi:hypothetical protein